jgi:hypothetical protein
MIVPEDLDCQELTSIIPLRTKDPHLENKLMTSQEITSSRKGLERFVGKIG